MKFFLDANIPYSALNIFKEFDLQAEHAKDIGLSKASDKEIIRYAIKTNSILVTKDLDFANILFYPPKSHHGIVVLRLPFYFKAYQFVNAIKEFLGLVNAKD